MVLSHSRVGPFLLEFTHFEKQTFQPKGRKEAPQLLSDQWLVTGHGSWGPLKFDGYYGLSS